MFKAFPTNFKSFLCLYIHIVVFHQTKPIDQTLPSSSLQPSFAINPIDSSACRPPISTMEKPTSAASSISGHHLSQAVAEPLLLLFYKAFFIWATMLHKLSFIRFPARSHADTCEEHQTTSSNPPVQVTEGSPSGEADLGLTKEDVESVMQILLGMPGGDHSEDAVDQKKLEEPLACAELTDMFEGNEPSVAEVKEAFSVFDEDCDGFIDPSELQRVLSKLGFREGLALDACEQMIAVHDENRDGRIDFTEFIKFMENILS